MSNEPPTLGAIVSNTNPAHLPGPEPLTGQHVTLERLTQTHFPDLYENIGSHADLWTWWPEGPFKTSPEFDDSLNELLNMSSDLAIYAVILRSGPNQGKAVGLAFALSEDRLTNRVAELGLFFGLPLQRTRAGTEVVYLLGGLLFELNHRRLQWKTNSLNLQSRKAAERNKWAHLEWPFKTKKRITDGLDPNVWSKDAFESMENISGQGTVSIITRALEALKALQGS